MRLTGTNASPITFSEILGNLKACIIGKYEQNRKMSYICQMNRLDETNKVSQFVLQ